MTGPGGCDEADFLGDAAENAGKRLVDVMGCFVASFSFFFWIFGVFFFLLDIFLDLFESKWLYEYEIR